MIAYAFPIARLYLATVFLYSGVDKLWHWRSSIEEVRSDGLPCRRFSPVPPSLPEFAWLGALLLAGFTVAATLLGHRFWLRHGNEFRHELTTSLEHVAIVGGLLLLSLVDLAAIG